jgi:hypothetical protein
VKGAVSRRRADARAVEPRSRQLISFDTPRPARNLQHWEPKLASTKLSQPKRTCACRSIAPSPVFPSPSSPSTLDASTAGQSRAHHVQNMRGAASCQNALHALTEAQVPPEHSHSLENREWACVSFPGGTWTRLPWPTKSTAHASPSRPNGARWRQ